MSLTHSIQQPDPVRGGPLLEPWGVSHRSPPAQLLSPPGPELTVADRRQKREIRQLEQELHKWQVLVDSITGKGGGVWLCPPWPHVPPPYSCCCPP